MKTFALVLSVTLCVVGLGAASLQAADANTALEPPVAQLEQALKAVPQTFREASLALGVSKWRTISRIVLPSALPGILTGAILGVGRAAGETARAVGIMNARQMLAVARRHFAGVCVMPPFHRFDLMAEVLN